MRTYGTLSHDAETRQWCITAEPQVVLRMKRVFGKMATSSTGEHRLTDSPENARDLEWFLERYPMFVPSECEALLSGRAQEHRDSNSLTEALLAGRVVAPAVPLALPLRNYQLQFVAMWKSLKRILLADDVGIGKTAATIGMLVDPDALPALIVTLTHLPKQWQSEIARFAPHLRTHVLKSTRPYQLGLGEPRSKSNQRTLPSATPDVIITSYSKLSGWAETLAGVVRSVAFDEVQELRKPESNRYAGAKRIADAAEYVTGLSATPIYNAGSEIFSVLDVIKPDALGSRPEFIREWCGQAYEGRERIRDPRAFGGYMLESGLILRRTRSEVGRELPPLTRVPHIVEANLDALDKVSANCRELALFIVGRGASPLKLEGEARKGEKLLASEELSNQLRQATGLAKAPYVAEFVRMLLESEQKVVLYGWHRAVYDIWLDRLKDLNPVMFTGSESASAKERSKQAFIEGEARVLVMSLRSGAGLDGLQKCCRTVVFGELDWAYGVHEQAEGRVSRDGQPDPVFAYYPNADCGTDPIMMDVLGIKRVQLDGLINPNAAMVERLQTDSERIKRLAESYLSQKVA